MSPYVFAEAILDDRTIALNHLGRIRRGYSYIDDDIVGGTLAILDQPTKDPSHRVFNLGAQQSEDIKRVVSLFEKALGKTARIELKPGIPGDMQETVADIDDTVRAFNWTPRIGIEQGIPLFVDWFKEYKATVPAVTSPPEFDMSTSIPGVIG